MNKEWSELNKIFQSLIVTKQTFEEGKIKLLELRKSMYDMIMLVKKSLNHKGYSLMPFPNSKGYDSKTMAYSIYHIARIDDIICNIIINNEEQVFDKGNYQRLLNCDIKTTGNELKGNEIIAFSEKLNINELFNYFNEVYQKTNSYIKSLEFSDLKRKVSLDKKQYLYETDYVSKKESAIWLIEYWCNKDIFGLLKMPFSRHWIMHVEAFLKIKNKIVLNEKRKNRNKISICGFSCNHCFLGQWCAGCRSEYNCCSYGTLFDDRVCPNVKCATENDLEGCYDCSSLDVCEIGFYTKKNDGAGAAKASAKFIRKHGKRSFVKTLDKMHKKYDFAKMQELLPSNSDEGLLILEKFMNDNE